MTQTKINYQQLATNFDQARPKIRALPSQPKIATNNGKALVDAFGHRKDDCREGLNPGSMAAAGVYFDQGELQPYKHSIEDKKALDKLSKVAYGYFRQFLVSEMD